MRRRYFSGLFALFVLTVISVGAEDFWLKKDWKQWSKDECVKMLADSPWTKTWRANGNEDGIVYVFQLRSALPIREAIVRRLQFDQKYDKMTDTQRATFDAQSGRMLSRSYHDIILVHVDFSKSIAALYLQVSLKQIQKGAADLDASLVTDGGNQVKSIRFDMNEKTPNEFDLLFPRQKDGTPLIKEGQKRFSVQFQSPQVDLGTAYPTFDTRSQRARVDFDLGKMEVAGKVNY